MKELTLLIRGGGLAALMAARDFLPTNALSYLCHQLFRNQE